MYSYIVSAWKICYSKLLTLSKRVKSKTLNQRSSSFIHVGSRNRIFLHQNSDSFKLIVTDIA